MHTHAHTHNTHTHTHTHTHTSFARSELIIHSCSEHHNPDVCRYMLVRCDASRRQRHSPFRLLRGQSGRHWCRGQWCVFCCCYCWCCCMIILFVVGGTCVIRLSVCSVDNLDDIDVEDNGTFLRLLRTMVRFCGCYCFHSYCLCCCMIVFFVVGCFVCWYVRHSPFRLLRGQSWRHWCRGQWCVFFFAAVIVFISIVCAVAWLFCSLVVLFVGMCVVRLFVYPRIIFEDNIFAVVIVVVCWSHCFVRSCSFDVEFVYSSVVHLNFMIFDLLTKIRLITREGRLTLAMTAKFIIVWNVLRSS